MNKKFLLTIFIFLRFINKSISSEFIGVIGVAVGDINNQKNEKLINGSKVFFGDTIFVKSKSNAQILFLDETVMTVGENTELTIDEIRTICTFGDVWYHDLTQKDIIWGDWLTK